MLLVRELSMCLRAGDPKDVHCAASGAVASERFAFRIMGLASCDWDRRSFIADQRGSGAAYARRLSDAADAAVTV